MSFVCVDRYAVQLEARVFIVMQFSSWHAFSSSYSSARGTCFHRRLQFSSWHLFSSSGSFLHLQSKTDWFLLQCNERYLLKSCSDDGTCVAGCTWRYYGHLSTTIRNYCMVMYTQPNHVTNSERIVMHHQWPLVRHTCTVLYKKNIRISSTGTSPPTAPLLTTPISLLSRVPLRRGRSMGERGTVQLYC